MSENEQDLPQDEEPQPRPSFVDVGGRAAKRRLDESPTTHTNTSSGETTERADFQTETPPQPQRRPGMAKRILTRLRGGPDATQPEPETKTSVGREQAARQYQLAEQCIIIGPRAAGKTFLLLAVGPSCGRRNDGIVLNLVPEAPAPEAPTGGAAPLPGDEASKQSISELMQKAAEIITGETTLDATEIATDYSFQIRVRGKIKVKEILPSWWRKERLSTTLNMTVSDGPGAHLFSDEPGIESQIVPEVKKWHKVLVRRAQQAKSLILCIDYNDPNTILLHRRLPDLIARMAVETEWYEEVELDMFTRVWYWLRGWRRPRRPFKGRCLNVDRFLILLNKIDVPFQGRIGAMDEANDIDTLEAARVTLGVKLLDQIQQVLKPDAKLAVGVTSALGFQRGNGLPLANKEGRVSLGANTKDEIINLWTPFGVREALIFIATGYARGKIHLIKPEELLEDDPDAELD